MDKITPARRSKNMARIQSRNMRPELAVRKMVHKMSYRYRLHGGELPGKPDLVFASLRKAVLVHGCFWHQHPDPDCIDARMPKSNLAYWGPKLQRNVERDAENRTRLEELGWKV